jgi:hypothetical protein
MDGSFVKQMTNYFHEIEGLNQLDYVFKKSSGFDPSTKQLRKALENHSGFFLKYALE